MASPIPGGVKAAIAAAKAIGVTSSGILKRATGSSYDPVTGAVTSNTTTDAFDLAPAEINAREFDGNLIQLGDRRYIIDGAKLVNLTEPHKDDLLEVDGEDWSVIYFEDYGKKAAFMLHVRKAQ